ncbi:hypothetical protein JG687_00010395 [Phytophthora cactorum]|uniref:Exoribonuclease phosphorolytic domain-containing protein n=1 Tax=Phytophthora cactorum TaxID=29920 RepID=A0A8T1U7B2_9STRA|nr:hypothetical protein JG687_00010395 [Phytophthora cactorum]
MVATTLQRQDGRAGNELRPFASEQGALFRADGSARMSHGSSTVLAAVYGPGQARNWRSEKTDKSTLDVCFKLEKGIMTSKEKEYEQIIRETFMPVVLTDSFPRAVISIVVQEAASWVTTARSSTSDGVLTCITNGLLSEEQYFACSEACQRASESVAAFFRIVQQKKHPLKSAGQ